MFGPHLTLEGYGCPSELLNDRDHLFKILDEYPDLLGMHKFAEPMIVEYKGDIPEDEGFSGIVLIAESHVAIHTFVPKNFVTLDIFSCKDFDLDKAIEHFKATYQPDSIDYKLFNRGRHFTHSEVPKVLRKQRDRSKGKKTSR